MNIIGLIFWGVLSFGASREDFDKAVDHLRAAQESFLVKDYKTMHELLLKSLRAYPNDSYLNAEAAKFARIYYAQNPDLEEKLGSLALTLSIQRRRKNNGPMKMNFGLSSKAKAEDLIQQATMILPDGREVRVYEEGKQGSSVYPSSTEGYFILRSNSDYMAPPLPIGVYSLKTELKGGRTHSYSLILWPDSDPKTMPELDVDREKGSIDWTHPMTPSHYNGVFRIANIYIYDRSAYRPLWTYDAKSNSREATRGKVKVKFPANSHSVQLYTYDSFMRGNVGMYYENIVHVDLDDGEQD